jgi:hypothetical protein
MLKLLLNVVTARTEALFVFGDKILNACVKEGYSRYQKWLNSSGDYVEK